MEANNMKPEHNIESSPSQDTSPFDGAFSFEDTSPSQDTLPSQDMMASQEIPLCQITEKSFEVLTGKIPEDKLDVLKSMKKRHFLKEELSQMLEKLNLSKEEIDIISSSSENLDKETFMKRYGMTPEKYREWKESLVTYKDNPSENPFYYIHPPFQILEEEDF